jgi:hypothetical protein
MFNATIHAALVMWAGPAFMWENGPLGKTGKPLLGTRPRTDTRNGLRAFLFDYSGGRCVFCEDNHPAEELAHIVAAGPQNDENGKRIRRGYVPGNIAPACHTINEIQGLAGPIVPLEQIAHPELIATVWPSETALRAMARGTRVA